MNATESLRDRLSYLGEAATRIGTRLDPGASARALASALVPQLADTVTVYLLEGLFTGERLDGSDGLRRVTGPRQPEELAHEVMRLDAPLQDGRLLAVPMKVRGRTLGAVLLERERGPHDEIDVMMAEQLAGQAALAADNAHRYRVEAAAADTLQRSMLPSVLPRFTGIELTHRYLPASDHARVGGDWFDAIALPGSRVALVVGDVMGHGMRSAAIMGQLRTSVHTLAALDLPPGQLLRQLDGLAQELGENHLATCLYAVYDPVARRVTFANAGHIPPVLVRRDGSAELLQVPPGVPIGVGGVAFEPIEFSVRDGDRLVLCTDGLVEVRGRDLMDGLTELCGVLDARRLPLDAQCEEVLRTLRGRQDDDVALLMADLNGIPATRIARWMLRPRPITPARVRRLIRVTLASWGLSDHSEHAELLATELVTNAVRYATRPIELRLLHTDGLLVEVSDDEHGLPVLRHADADDEGGRGIQLVSRLAHQWGATRTATGKIVWFRLNTQSEGP
ncbi:ATP-binding SpoIIE family protein phosphatase [Actinocorallia populi]|uniref:ATP-binding SpoIIE family protein phosphatase n=1 Tax=Actinocorallia populi TaxID=2079200 RepID=UPI000D08BB9C|nr:ATP-binding SpoIIE family protein phosphatase [Actinocorallia populi]